MQAYDVFMIAVLVSGAVWGAWKGLAWQIASIASMGLSYFVAVNFRAPVSRMFHYEPPEWNSFLAMLVLYLGTSLVVWVGFNMLRDFIERFQLKEFDRQIGGVVGLAKGAIVCTIITLFTVGLGTESQRQAVIQSRSGYYIAGALKQIEPLMPAEYRPKVDEAIARLEDRHGVPRGSYLERQRSPFSWLDKIRGQFGSQTGGDSNFGSSWNSGVMNPPGGASSWGTQPQGQGAGGGFVDTFGGGGNGNGGGFDAESLRRFQSDVLPRIEEEQRRLQQEIERYQSNGFGS